MTEPMPFPGPATLDELLSAGLTSAQRRRDCRAGRMTRTFRGVYGSPNVVDVELHQLLSAHAHLGPESTAVLRSALRLHKIDGVMGEHVPQLAMPPGLEKHQRAGVDIHFWKLSTDEVCVVGGVPATTVARTLADSARLLPRMQAVSCLDSALNLGLISIQELLDLRGRMSRKRQCVAGRLRLLEARVGAQSPLETRVRLRASDAGLEPDALQVPIRSVSSVLLGYGDMGYELPDGSWLIVEADGLRYHDQPDALLHDRRRQNAFLNARVASIVRFTWDDATHDAYIPSVLGAALSKAGWRRQARRP